MHKTARERSCQTLKLHIDFLFDFVSPTRWSNPVLLIFVSPAPTTVSETSLGNDWKAP